MSKRHGDETTILSNPPTQMPQVPRGDIDAAGLHLPLHLNQSRKGYVETSTGAERDRGGDKTPDGKDGLHAHHLVTHDICIPRLGYDLLAGEI